MSAQFMQLPFADGGCSGGLGTKETKCLVLLVEKSRSACDRAIRFTLDESGCCSSSS